VGVEAVKRSLQRFGLPEEVPRNPSLLLGALDLTPIEVAQLYGGLANGGFRTTLRAVRAVISADGKPLQAYPVEVQPVAQSDAVYQVNSMLEQVFEHGTGRPALAVLPRGLVVVGKTGTSSEFRDSWFAGFSGSHLAVVWVGYDNDAPTGLEGATGALAVWSHLMADVSESSWIAPMPETLQEVTIDYATGMRAQAGCSSDLVSVPVPPGTDPPVKPGCPGASLSATIGSATADLLERAGRWLKQRLH